jgi:LacI family transcriptional regulator
MLAICGHLAQLGHRRVTYLAGPAASWANSERVRAFTAAQAFGLSVTVLPCGATSHHGYDTAPAALETEATAVVTYNDLVAMGALTRLRELNIEVPAQLSLIGFDDISPNGFASSPVTTVTVSRDQLGHQAGTMLELHLTTGADSEPRYIPMELLVRSTSATPNPALTT